MYRRRFPRRYLAVTTSALLGISLTGCGGGNGTTTTAPPILALPSRYRVVDLGFSGEMNSGALKINNTGGATGSYQRGDRATRAFLYTGTTPPTDIGTLGGASSVGVGINNSNVVVGSAGLASGALSAFSYSGGTMTALETPSNLNSRGNAINNAGTPLIVGALFDSVGAMTATTWRNNVRTNLPLLGFTHGTAMAVNDFDQIAGAVNNTATDSRAVLWSGGAGVQIGLLPGGTSSFARGINNFGQVVGFGDTAGTSQQAFLWTPDSANGTVGTMISLGSLGGTSIGYDINSRGVIVGTATDAAGNRRGFAWSPTTANGTTGTMTDLNSLLIPDSSGWVIEFATSINDGDTIVGWGRSPSGQAQRAILLQPA